MSEQQEIDDDDDRTTFELIFGSGEEGARAYKETVIIVVIWCCLVLSIVCLAVIGFAGTPESIFDPRWSSEWHKAIATWLSIPALLLLLGSAGIRVGGDMGFSDDMTDRFEAALPLVVGGVAVFMLIMPAIWIFNLIF